MHRVGETRPGGDFPDPVFSQLKGWSISLSTSHLKSSVSVISLTIDVVTSLTLTGSRWVSTHVRPLNDVPEMTDYDDLRRFKVSRWLVIPVLVCLVVSGRTEHTLRGVEKPP